MKKNCIYLIFIALTILFSGCDNDSMTIFKGDVPSIDKRFNKSMYYNEEHGYPVLKVKDLYICLDSAQGKIGSLQMKWLRNLLQKWYGSFRHVIVFSHVNIFRRENTSADISTTALEETYELMWLFSEYGVKQFWAGHDHSREEFTEGGVKYIIVDSMEENNPEAAYMILHVGAQLNNTFHFINESDEEE